MNSNTPSQQSNRDKMSAGKDKLSSDFKSVISDGEQLVGGAAAQGSDGVTLISSRVTESLAAAERLIVEKSKATARVTDAYVRENPWRSLLIASGVSVVLGFIITRMMTPSRT
jgi:ElaB/YqjD/DUF883 family membrane-anchored ribosome-binding protein